MEMRVQTIIRECVGRTMVDPVGDEIGTIQAVYIDDTTAQPEWFAVKTGWFGRSVNFVPVTATSVRGLDVQSLYSKATVQESPKVESEGHLTPDEQHALFDYYDVNNIADRDPADLEAPPPTPSAQLANDTGERPLVDPAIEHRRPYE
jgi:hypothetical protein